jgi:PTS system cellobiose-specific IIB component
MRKVKVVILCAAAMSSAFIVESMAEKAPQMDIDLDAECYASLRYRYYDYSKADFVLLAPQVKGQKEDVEKFIREKGFTVPVAVIPMRDYGLMRGDNILQFVIDSLEENKG